MPNSKINFDFHKSFRPKRYLKEYYKKVGSENTALLNFFSKSYAYVFQHLSSATALELGGGPTLYQLISLSAYPVSIDFAEFAPQNLDEINRWLSKHKNKFSWKKYFIHVNNLELHLNHSNIKREELLRSKISKVIKCDIREEYSLGQVNHHKYDIVSSHFVSESVTPDKNAWSTHIKHVCSFVKPSGYLVLSSIIGAKHYKVGSKRFPATPVSIDEINDLILQNNFKLINTDFIKSEDQPNQGYVGLHMLLAQKLAI